jgi:hypothetical protein
LVSPKHKEHFSFNTLWMIIIPLSYPKTILFIERDLVYWLHNHESNLLLPVLQGKRKYKYEN